jgi:hypothetical protein
LSSAEFEGDLKESGEPTEDGQDNDQLASKLSKELSNWRRKRTSSRPRHNSDGPSQNFSSEPARTIKVRGHETLVVRKPKLAKPPTNTNHTPNNQ